MHSSAQPLRDAVVVISDLVQDRSDFPEASEPVFESNTAGDVSVEGGYLERLPLALVRAGRARFAEIWHHHRGEAITARRDNAALARRAFPGSGGPPFHSDAMVEFIHRHGAPRILCVLGLGVSEAVLEACGESLILYNSIDVPALRVPAEISRHFDLVITGADWQSADVRARHPHMPTLVLPIGPDFASPETFFPIPGPKPYDLIYVAAAQPYKRHDILFAALQRSPRPLRALCVMGYGDDGDRLRHEAHALGLAVDFVGPPGVPHAEVNRLMNTAKIGVVCGENDGAPAILTEYMLAGLPVVANAALRCGLDYIRPETGLAAPADRFEHAIIEALACADFTPRQTVLDHWAWPHSVRHLGAAIDALHPAPVPMQPDLMDISA
ncbi:Glycosyl transferases group 1 [Devosia enhydra]|uniref:Glycosyl transferases group 1 n=1 Tax=Devosia enhydra TaxID=665118 RepID=A0A1K2HXZ0_9HYPH|nr:glycosyltransferase [Devosia enhydra]SFZ84697.1 Glycosyl transferases group 1 [Devosia enhydra]